MDLPSGRKRKGTEVEWGDGEDDDAARKKDLKQRCIDKFVEFLNNIHGGNYNHRPDRRRFSPNMDLPSSEIKRKRTEAECADEAGRKIRLFTDKYGHDQIVEAKEISSSIQSRSAKWSELPTDLLELILIKNVSSESHVLGFKDILSFKAVCQSWRAAAKSCSSYVQLPRSPCLLLPNRNNWSIFDPSLGKVYTMRNVDCDHLFPNGTIVGSSYGWIVMFYKDKYSKKSKAHIFNPITGASIPIPGKQTLPNKNGRTVTQAIISSNPSCSNNFVVVVEYDSRLAYYKHGDQDMFWKKLDDGNHGDMPYKHLEYPIYFYDRCLINIVFHGDHLVASAGKLTKVWNFKECPPLQCSIIKDSPDHRSLKDNYLVESLTGDILRLGKGWGETEYLRDYQFCVEKLNLAEGKWENLQRLGDHQSLFVFRKQLMSLPNPCFLGYEKNSIYFGVPKSTKWKEYYTYNLEKAKLDSYKKFKFSKGGIDGCRRPLWIVPNPW